MTLNAIYEVRRATLNDVATYRDIRLASLEDSPRAFETTLDSAVKRTPASWVELVQSTQSGSARNTALGFRGNEAVGVAALYQDPQRPKIAELIQFWVNPQDRGTPLAGMLIGYLETWALQSGFTDIVAGVDRDNERALNFYRKHGFNVTNDSRLLQKYRRMNTMALAKNIHLQ